MSESQQIERSQVQRELQAREQEWYLIPRDWTSFPSVSRGETMVGGWSPGKLQGLPSESWQDRSKDWEESARERGLIPESEFCWKPPEDGLWRRGWAAGPGAPAGPCEREGVSPRWVQCRWVWASAAVTEEASVRSESGGLTAAN